jgi:RimJ/RimL family protein N-acetyltransferase
MTLTLRPATEADAWLLLDWRNDATTRRNSIDGSEVAWDDHVHWLSTTLARADRRLLIAELGQEAVGTARFDQTGDHCTLSWTVAPSHRGRGIGRELVACAIRHAHVPLLFASIKDENIASIRIAEACGFERSGSEDGLSLYRLDRGRH